MEPARTRRLIASGVCVLIVGATVWVVSSARDEDSTLSIVAKYVAKQMGWAADSTTADVLQRMARHERNNRNDEAIKAGVAWTEQHPHDGSSYLIYRQIALLYLEKARLDSGRADEYVAQAISHRDKALSGALDNSASSYSMAGLQELGLISELAGDLSAKQRCKQYRNAVKLLDQLKVRLMDEGFEAPGLTPDEVEQFRERVDATISRVQQKMQNNSCEGSSAP